MLSDKEKAMQSEIDILKKQLSEKDLITTEAKVQAEVEKQKSLIAKLKADLETRPQKSDATTLKVVDFDRDRHSGLPKGTILGVLES